MTVELPGRKFGETGQWWYSLPVFVVQAARLHMQAGRLHHETVPPQAAATS